MANYDSIDADFTWDGDYVVGSDGDLGDTRSNYLTSLYNEIRSTVRSEIGDWEKHPLIGPNLSEYRGEPNNRRTVNRMQQALISALTSNDIVQPGDLSIRIVPVGPYQVLILINVSVQATPNNGLEPGQTLDVSISYDSLEDSIFFLPPSETLKAYLRS